MRVISKIISAMTLSDNNRNTLLIQLHKSIEENAGKTAVQIFLGRLEELIHYPPNGGLNKEESLAMEKLKGNEILQTALRKVFASNSSDVIFELFNLIDGTADPDPEIGEWSEVLIIDKPDDFDEDIDFLHDGFFETYNIWKSMRNNSNWALDLNNED